MIVTIQPGNISGTIQAPASKSSMQRACAAALLHHGETIISHPGYSNDDNAAIQLIREMGASVTGDGNILRVKSDGVRPLGNTVNCGESGLGIRMFVPIISLSKETITIHGEGSLLQRPLDFFDAVLPELGVRIISNAGRLPLQVKGPLQPRNIEIDGSLSSQFLTGLLLAYSAADARDISITVTNLKSRPYIDLTLDVMQKFGMNVPENRNYEEFYFKADFDYAQSAGTAPSTTLRTEGTAPSTALGTAGTAPSTTLRTAGTAPSTTPGTEGTAPSTTPGTEGTAPSTAPGTEGTAPSSALGTEGTAPSSALRTYTVEGDWSGGAFLLVAGAIAGNIVVEGLDGGSTQADKAILVALQQAGANLFVQPNRIEIGAASLEAFHFNATDCPDLFPPLVALAAYCNGKTVIEGVTRLKHKESNRAITLQKEFGKMGIQIELQNDLMMIYGDKVQGASVHSNHDHRIAMACAVAALKAEGKTTIGEAQAVNKSYPDFYEHIQHAGALLTTDQSNETINL